MRKPMSRWTTLRPMALSARSLTLLLANRIPAIRLERFASISECERLAQAVERLPVEYYEGVNPPIARIGVTQFECRKLERSHYFERAREAESARRKLAASSFDAVQRFRARLAEVWGSVALASEPAYGSYFAGLIRHIANSASLHVDFGFHDAPDWEVGKVISQLAWNLYVTTPSSGGECIVYNREWSREDEEHRLSGSYGYDDELVNGVQSFLIWPKCGDITIFNCRNFHRVSPVNGRRLTTGSFIGQMPDDRLVLWS